jgi:4-amino-4-deoxy-L-arabinose transferase-like glycosyltransferase
MSARLRALRPWLKRWHEPNERGWQDVVVAGAIAIAYLVLLLATVDDLGYARDEGFYFDAARAYEEWFSLLARDPSRALADADHYWQVNSEHPSLVKTLFALSHAWLWDGARRFAMEGTSFRFPAMVLSCLGIATTYLWGARARGRLVGLVAAGSLAAMPRFFFHAHLACFDAPIVAMWTLCAYCYWRALQCGGVWRALLAGLTFGLALDTKHNAWFLPIVCGAHSALLQLPRVGGSDRATLARRSMSVLGCMALVGPLTMIALWPWVWRDTLARLWAYAQFHLQHVYYNMELFGRNYFEPPMPRSYAFVMTLATVPAITLLAFAIGVAASAVTVRRVSRKRQPLASIEAPATEILWLLAIAVQYAAWLRPTTPIFGGTKHWMTAYPFLALFAGIGVAVTVRAARVRHWTGSLSRLAHGRGLEPLHLAVAVLVPAVQAAHAHPWALSHYNVVVGGAAGAATLGLNRGFWGYTTGAIAPYLNRAVPPDGTVYPHDTAGPSWDMLVRDGRLRPDIRARWSAARADVALYHHELHMAGVEHQSWVAFETVAPDAIAGLDGVPVIWTYRRR